MHSPSHPPPGAASSGGGGAPAGAVKLVVKAPTPGIAKVAGTQLVKQAALRELHRLHRDAPVHRFGEEHLAQHAAAWKVLKFAEEGTPAGQNFLLKVDIGAGLSLHARVHKQAGRDVWEFHSLCRTTAAKGGAETCCWPHSAPLEFFAA